MDMMREMKARQKYEELEKTLQLLAPEAAIAKISQFIQEYFDYPQANNDLAVLLHQQGELLQALGRYERAVRLSPRNSTFLKNLASFYFVELGWTDDAILIYTELLKENSEDTEVLEALAIISNIIGGSEEAELFLRRILELEPWNNNARSMLSSLSVAGITAAPVIMAVPTPTVVPSELDSLLADLRQTISQMAPPDKSPEERYRSAKQFADQGLTANAMQELEELVQAFPDYALAFNDLGVLYQLQGENERSLAAHQQAVCFEPRNPVFRKNLANLLYAVLGRTDEAIAIFIEVLGDYPEDVETLLALGQISAVNNCNEQAKIFVGKVLELEPWNTDAREFYRLIA